MLKLTIIPFLLLCCLISYGLNAQEQTQVTITLTDTIPLDPAITKGMLANGLTYYIKYNAKPEKRAELRLAVNAGSILEDKDQLGLAHFTEHMAFNGTEHFKKHELVDYLESVGMKFGPEINAYTSFDETVYQLQIPTDSLDIMEKSFLVLRDWANGVSFDDDEIDKERGVVIEEWRLGRNADTRMLDKQFPILFHGSRYAKRIPIGKKEILESFNHDVLRRFYHDWYRPELMAVIAVGDFDVNFIKQLINKNFANIPLPQNPRPRVFYPVPEHNETLYAIASDSEATRSTVGIYYKLPTHEERTVQDYRQNMIERVYHNMFNQRLSELTREENPPFMAAFSGKMRYVRTGEFYILLALVKDNGIPLGLETLLREAIRVEKFGFTSTELEREKKSVLRSMEQIYRERDKTDSQAFAEEYIRNFLQDEPIPGIEYEYKVFQEFVPGIKLEEVNALAKEWLSDKSRVVMANSPEKKGMVIPSKSELEAVLEKVSGEKITAYVDDILNVPLVENPPKSQPVVSERYFKDLDVSEWKLANGITVVLKPTDFKNDEILFSATSPGGYSLVPDSNLVAAETATSVITQSGIGEFKEDQLTKLLADEVVRVSPYIGQLTEGFSGRVSPQDKETLFQLIYLYFVAPRKDSTVFASVKSRLEGYYQNRSASPEAAYRDTITAVITQNDPRFKPWTVATFQEMNLNKSVQIYMNRFADASDFIFFFVGNFELNVMKPLVETYLGGLPDLNREEKWSNKTYEYPQGIIEKKVYRGKEPKSLNTIIITGPYQWSRLHRYHANAMLSVLRIKLRERIREDLGGTYGVRVRVNFSHYPVERYKINIEYGADPNRVEELIKEVYIQIDSLTQFGTTDKYLEKVKESQLRDYETNMKENDFWLNNLEFKYFHHEDPYDIINYTNMVENLTLDDIQTAARQYLNRRNLVWVVLYPEE